MLFRKIKLNIMGKNYGGVRGINTFEPGRPLGNLGRGLDKK